MADYDERMGVETPDALFTHAVDIIEALKDVRPFDQAEADENADAMLTISGHVEKMAAHIEQYNQYLNQIKARGRK